MSEEWRPIPGYDGYEASNAGRIRSWKKWRNSPVPRILKASPQSAGYPFVILMLNGTETSATVHKLVGLTFLGPCPEGMQMRHLDDDQTNCSVENLKWGTASQNMQDQYANGRGRWQREPHGPREAVAPIRAWARATGIPIGQRGHIAQDVIDAYHDLARAG